MKKYLTVLAVILAGTLFSANLPDWKIYYSPELGPTGKYASEELQGALKKIFKVEIPITEGKPNGNLQSVIVLSLSLEVTSPDEIIIQTKDGRLELAGGSPRSVLYAVYAFLQDHLGVRYLWPGADGEFFPKLESWDVPELNRRWIPAIKYRGFHLCGDWRDVDEFKVWMVRNFINIHRHGTQRGWQQIDRQLGLYGMYSTHNVDSRRLPKDVLEKHPEYLAEINGKHYPGNLCWSNPEVDKLMVEHFRKTFAQFPTIEIASIFPSDSMNYCRCSKCAEMDVSTAWFTFLNRLTDTLRAEFPNMRFASIAYQGYMAVPKVKIRNLEFVEYATYMRCNFHTLADPKCPLNVKLAGEVAKWRETGIPIGNYTYEFDVFKDNLMLPFFSQIEDTIRSWAAFKSPLIMTEVGLSPSREKAPDEGALSVKNRLSQYLYARMLWNPEAGTEALIKEYCNLAYGEAGREMSAYFQSFNHAWGTMSEHATIGRIASQFVDSLVTPEVTVAAAKAFEAARKVSLPRERRAVQLEQTFFMQYYRLLSRVAKFDIPKVADEGKPELKTIGWNSKGLLVEGKSELVFAAAPGAKEYKISLASGQRNHIPFEKIGCTPVQGESYLLKFNDMKDFAVVTFSSRSEVNRTLVYWNGAKEREEKNNSSVTNAFGKQGYKLKIVSSAAELDPETPQVYYFRHPDGPDKVPQEAWNEIIAPAIRNGAIAVFTSYWNLPLERYFGDASFKVDKVPVKSNLAARRSSFVAPGEWSTIPNNLTFHLTKRVTPAYGWEPAEPEQWLILAKMPRQEDPADSVPYLMARRYGEGMIVVIGPDSFVPQALLVENLHQNKDILKKQEVKNEN